MEADDRAREYPLQNLVFNRDGCLPGRPVIGHHIPESQFQFHPLTVIQCPQIQMSPGRTVSADFTSQIFQGFYRLFKIPSDKSLSSKQCVFMTYRMNPYVMTVLSHSLNQIRILPGSFCHDKETGLNMVLLQKIQKLVRIRLVRSVVKGQVQLFSLSAFPASLPASFLPSVFQIL